MGVGTVFPWRTGGAAGVRGHLARYERGPWQGVTRWWARGWNLPWRHGALRCRRAVPGTVTAAARPLAAGTRPGPGRPGERRARTAARARAAAAAQPAAERPGAAGRGEQPCRAGRQQPGRTGQQRDRADASGSGPGQRQRNDHHRGGEPSGRHRPHPQAGACAAAAVLPHLPGAAGDRPGRRVPGLRRLRVARGWTPVPGRAPQPAVSAGQASLRRVGRSRLPGRHRKVRQGR